MHWFVESLQNNPSLAIFLTLGLGFLVGQLKYKSFSLGNVTSVLLVGVLIGQLDIPIPGPIKTLSFSSSSSLSATASAHSFFTRSRAMALSRCCLPACCACCASSPHGLWLS